MTTTLVHACVQVANKDADQVKAEVEALAYRLAEQIMSGEGLTLDIPSRAKGNQVGLTRPC